VGDNCYSYHPHPYRWSRYNHPAGATPPTPQHEPAAAAPAPPHPAAPAPSGGEHTIFYGALGAFLGLALLGGILGALTGGLFMIALFGLANS
jgi:predicted lipid-binding transport protein (Tim44 family)